MEWNRTMHSLNGLPKTAYVTIEDWSTGLIIKNHKVADDHSLMYMILFMIENKQWKHILPQFISQGFKIDGVIEECIRNMKDQIHVNYILYNFYSGGKVYGYIKQNSQSPEIVKIIGCIIKKLKTCKNWNQLYQMMRKNSDFQKEMQKKMKEVIIQ